MAERRFANDVCDQAVGVRQGGAARNVCSQRYCSPVQGVVVGLRIMRASAAMVAMTCLAALQGCAAEQLPSASTGSSTTRSLPAAVGPTTTAIVTDNGVTVTQQADGVLVTATAPDGVADSGTVLKISAQAPAGAPFEAQVAASGPVRLSPAHAQHVTIARQGPP